MITITNRQARQFILLKQGLLGEHKFAGKQGVLDFISQAGCVQFDPVDVCGRYAEAYDSRGGDAVKRIIPLIRQLIEERGHISAAEVCIDETIEWHWGTMSSLPRAAAFKKLLDEGLIFEVKVEGLKDLLYICEDDRAVLETVLSEKEFLQRCELIAPLDSLIWDRKLIKALFGFEYTWEIYTPAVKRKYGAYVLPVLHGDRLVGRVEAVCERKSKPLLSKTFGTRTM